MSPDDIFAAQMWPWPDPLVKRDNAGHIVFVNAAFLALYGGRVENWTGNVLPGWPAPSPQPAPYRFETRAGAAPSETVYDWVEVTMADGHALAIARDVTVFQMPPAPLPTPVIDPVTPQVPPAALLQAAPIAPEAAPIMQQVAPPPVAEAAPEPLSVAPEAVVPVEPTPEPISEPVIEAIIVPEPVAPVAETVAVAEPSPAPVAQLEAVVTPDVTEPAVLEPVAQQVSAAMPEITIPEPQPIVEAPRDFERRALPIEDDEALLGSNWRDAVIARAVGNDLPSVEAVSTVDSEPEVSAQIDQPRQGLRILLAEDNAINALLTRTLLEADGCTVETVEDAYSPLKR
jgi:hypothetical protein